jgi:tRNA-2-methylthio-N6-dimethylallyladenosine synthase
MVIKNHANISRSIHLPLQSGSDDILNKMNRKYDLKHYYEIVEQINKNLDNYALSTDLIVGFPGETELDYKNTLNAVKELRFDEAYMYAYSTRSGTKAAEYTDQLDENIKKERLKKLIELQREITTQKLSKRINKQEHIFIERISKKSDNEVMGKSFLNHPVIIPGNINDIGKDFQVKITDLKGSTLYGQRIA